jgi:teichuronic acid biosynthesis glycosyltransferase TuaC
VKVLVVAEFYPRAEDPVLGVWAHRQAVAARDAGVEIEVLVLQRLVPPKAAFRARDAKALLAPLRQPRRTTKDGIPIRFVPFVSPARETSYAGWGAWAAPTLRLALRTARPFDLLHAHYAVPAADAVRRAAPRAPVVVSVHGGDVLWTGPRSPAGAKAVTRNLRRARLVLANSAGTARRCATYGAPPERTRVVHLGADLVPARAPAAPPRLVTVGHLVARKRNADVIRALPGLPGVVYDVVGDGPERAALEALARALGVDDRVVFHGRLSPAGVTRVLAPATAFVLPSDDEAFGVAYVEAMAAGVPAVGLEGEDGPEEIAALGGGLTRVPPHDPVALTGALRRFVDEPGHRAAEAAAARATAETHFTWAGCGAATIAAYEDALRR